MHENHVLELAMFTLQFQIIRGVLMKRGVAGSDRCGGGGGGVLKMFSAKSGNPLSLIMGDPNKTLSHI